MQQNHRTINDSFAFVGEVQWQKTRNGILVAESPWMRNKVVSSDARGISIVLDRLASINTYSLNITHADIGDDNTPATASDTALGNTLERAQVGSVSRSGLTVSFRFFFSDALTADDTYHEFGMVIDGTGTLGTGRLFNHLIFSTALVKATGEDHTIVCRITGTV